LNLYDTYEAKQRPEVAVRKKTLRDYGYVSSPLVLGDLLLVEVGGNRGNLVAFDKATGKERWGSQNRDEAAYTGGPVPITVNGTQCVAVLTLRNLVVTAIEGSAAGTTVATYPWTTDYGNNVATPAVFEDSVIITSAYNRYAMCRVRITQNGAEKVWENKMASKVCSPLVHDGHVYWAWEGVHCVNLTNGEEVWSGGKIGSQGSCIVTADDRMIVYGNKGDLSLVETAKRSPDEYRVLSSTDAWPHVVLANGRVLCRDRDGHVMCLSVSDAATP
jgi:outer membrane protein assembly factor BamB